VAGHVYTLVVVLIGWVFFRADTLAGAVGFLKALAGLSPAAPTPFTVGFYLTSELWLVLAAGIIGSMPWVPALAARLAPPPGAARRYGLELLGTAALVALLGASIINVAARTYNPFIYFRF
jgi:alginate O-acetyltransferase complex protein AlgI